MQHGFSGGGRCLAFEGDEGLGEDLLPRQAGGGREIQVHLCEARGREDTIRVWLLVLMLLLPLLLLAVTLLQEIILPLLLAGLVLLPLLLVLLLLLPVLLPLLLPLPSSCRA